MTRFFLKMMAVFAVLLALPTTAAMAQATRTWVSGVGDDANPCSRTAPCKTFAGAISKTAAGGEINVLDPGGFGGVTITKSITIRADGIESGVLVSGTSGITINAGVNDQIVLQGLDIEGLSNGTSVHGINVLAAKDVIIIDCEIRGFNSASSAGIRVNNSVANAAVTVENTRIFSNTIGILVNSPGGNARAKIIKSLIVDSTLAGIQVLGAGNTATISGNGIFQTPASVDFGAGGVIESYGDNILGGSTTDVPGVLPKL